MLLVLFELNLLGKIICDSVNPDSDKSAFTDIIKLLDIFALSCRRRDSAEYLPSHREVGGNRISR